MATATDFLGLVKPAEGETYSVGTLNDNSDKVDAGVKALSDNAKKPRIAFFSQIAVKAMVAGNGTPMGPLTVGTGTHANQTQNNTFCKVKNAGVIGLIEILEDGDYDISYKWDPTTTPANVSGYIVAGGYKVATLAVIGNYGETNRTLAGRRYLKVGDTIGVYLASSVTLNFACDISIRKIV